MDADYSLPFLLQSRQLSATPDVPPKTVCNISISIESMIEGIEGQILWDNCCSEDEENPVTSCPPREAKHTICPVGYHSCADVDSHPEMCDLVTGMTYTDAKPLSNKCCPLDYSCGPSFDSPCQYRFPNATNSQVLGLTPRFTNPQYAETPGVFHGCDRNGIAPSAVGAIIATGVITFCLITAFFLWLIRRRIYRNPRKRVSRQRMKMLEGSMSGSIRDAPLSRGKDVEVGYGEKRALKPGEFEMVVPPCRISKEDEKERERAQQTLEEARIEITVTREVQIQTIEEHVEQLQDGQSTQSLVSDGGSGSSGGMTAVDQGTSEESLKMPRQGRVVGDEITPLERAVTHDGRIYAHARRPGSRTSLGYRRQGSYDGALGVSLQRETSLQGKSWLFDEEENEQDTRH